MNQKIKNIIKLSADNIFHFFPYFFVFYFVCVLVATIFPAMRDYFYWPALHVGLIVFGAISLLDSRFWNYRTKKEPNNKIPKIKTAKLPGWVSVFRRLIFSQSYWDHIKVLIIFIGAIIAINFHFGPAEFLIFIYALISLFFVIDVGVTIVISVIFLFFCPFLAFFDNGKLSEQFAVYVFYLFIVAVLTQIRILLFNHSDDLSTGSADQLIDD